jgi:hypothetical protein
MYPGCSGAVSSAGRAPALQAGGHWFDPGTAHRSGRVRPGRVPKEVDEQPEEWDDEDEDDPEQLAADSEIPPAENAGGDEQPDEDPQDKRDGGKPLTVGVRKSRHAGREPTAQSVVRLLLLALASAVSVALFAGCGGGDDAAKVEANLRHYLSTLNPRPSGFPVGAARVKENSCKKVSNGEAAQARRPQGPPASWSCVVRFAHTPFRVLVALKDNGDVAWALPLPRQVLRPATSTADQGGSK